MQTKEELFKAIVDSGQAKADMARRNTKEFVEQKWSQTEMFEILNGMYYYCKKVVDTFDGMKKTPTQKNFEITKGALFSLNRFQRKEFVNVFASLYSNRTIPKITEINKLNLTDPEAAKLLAIKYGLEYNSIISEVKKHKDKRKSSFVAEKSLTTLYLIFIPGRKIYQITSNVPKKGFKNILLKKFRCILAQDQNLEPSAVGKSLNNDSIVISPKDGLKYLVMETKMFF
jgi:uncharacterized protein (UPF0305 family)